MEFGIGGFAAVCAGFFTNPLEVMKVRMQLQGELLARGEHAVYYRNVFHAGYVIAKHDGVLALQAGLAPALWFQLFLNGVRLGTYQTLVNLGFTKDKAGKTVIYKNAVAAGFSGMIGSVIGSPLYLVKTHLQSKAAREIAFGHQHRHAGMVDAISGIYKQFGVKGLFRGTTAAIPRAFFGSLAQLTSFSYCKDQLDSYKVFQKKPLTCTFVASMIGGVIVAMVMAPFDLISTRLYNQGVDANGRGLLYSNYADCVQKIYKSEGLLAFYKGIGACYFRLGPHTVLTLVFWDQLKTYRKNSNPL